MDGCFSAFNLQKLLGCRRLRQLVKTRADEEAMAGTGARSAAIASPDSFRSCPAPCGSRPGLSDIGHIPVEDGAIFVDEAPHIADELAALALRLDRRARQ
jgi:hypothetical protein